MPESESLICATAARWQGINICTQVTVIAAREVTAGVHGDSFDRDDPVLGDPA